MATQAQFHLVYLGGENVDESRKLMQVFMKDAFANTAKSCKWQSSANNRSHVQFDVQKANGKVIFHKFSEANWGKKFRKNTCKSGCFCVQAEDCYAFDLSVADINLPTESQGIFTSRNFLTAVLRLQGMPSVATGGSGNSRWWTTIFSSLATAISSTGNRWATGGYWCLKIYLNRHKILALSIH